jgi:hypothetical protein
LIVYCGCQCLYIQESVYASVAYIRSQLVISRLQLPPIDVAVYLSPS